MFSNEFMYNRCEKENITWTTRWTIGIVRVYEMLHYEFSVWDSLDQEICPNAVKECHYNRAAE